MSTITVRLLATGTIETLPDTTPALGVHRFSKMYRDTYGAGEEVPAEVHTDPMWAGPEVAGLQEEFVDELEENASTLETVGAEGYVLLRDAGDDCDVWARYATV